MKILLVTGRFPWPPRRGDELRNTQLLRFLGERHHLTLLAPDPGPAHQLHVEPGCAVVTYRPSSSASLPWRLARSAAAGLPFENALLRHGDLARKLRELAPRADLVILSLARLAGLETLLGGRPFVTDLIDSLSLNLCQRARVDFPWLRPLFAWEAAAMQRAERKLVEGGRAAWLVSPRDRDRMAGALGPALAGRLAVIPLAVQAAAAPAAPAGEVLAFTGNLGYFPNHDALAWLLAAVWPELQRRRPAARLLVAGTRPPSFLRRAAGRSGIELVEAPPDLGAVLRRAALTLAPMRCGSGLPIKVLEAWAQGRPVVATPYAAAGTTGVPGTDLEVLDGAEAWIEGLDRLLGDPERLRALATNGQARLVRDYSAEVVREGLEAELARVAGA